MKSVYRTEKRDGKWYVIRHEEIASEPFPTKKQAETCLIRRMASDLHYEEICWKLSR